MTILKAFGLAVSLMVVTLALSVSVHGGVTSF